MVENETAERIAIIEAVGPESNLIRKQARPDEWPDGSLTGRTRLIGQDVDG